MDSFGFLHTNTHEENTSIEKDNGIDGVNLDIGSISMYVECMKIRSDLYKPESSHNKLLKKLEDICRLHIKLLSEVLNNKDPQTQNVAIFLSELFKSNLEGTKDLNKFDTKQRFSEKNLNCSFKKVMEQERNLDLITKALINDFNGATNFIDSDRRWAWVEIIVCHAKNYQNCELTTQLLQFAKRLDSKTYHEIEAYLAPK